MYNIIINSKLTIRVVVIIIHCSYLIEIMFFPFSYLPMYKHLFLLLINNCNYERTLICSHDYMANDKRKNMKKKYRCIGQKIANSSDLK